MAVKLKGRCLELVALRGGRPPEALSLRLTPCSSRAPWVSKWHPQPQSPQVLPTPWGKGSSPPRTRMGRAGTTPGFLPEPRPGEPSGLGELTLGHVHQG